jgi:hypothetical protein
MSRPYLNKQMSKRPALNRQQSVSRRIGHSSLDFSFRDGNASGAIAPIQKKIIVHQRNGKNMRRFLPGKEIEERPPRSIILIWVIVAAELGFDFATTIIAFISFLEDDTCCGKPITLG